MSDVVIRVENLSKRYRIGQREAAYKTLRESITNLFTAPFRHLRENPKSEIRNSKSNNHIWALKDVSFEVKQGEVVGIIGRNGAGKTTLLKILSRITEPTKGYAEIRGRVGSLLEVGTGFHPELTGRENIYLSGAILGMKKAEIDRKFDEIVGFAELEKFIDTPVKRYSSGMYVRLAFAVAAHLEPEILLVDEVLAVGDVAFQKKCLGKMGDVAKEGRTVLFVSHNMGAIQALCSRAILLQTGRIACEGSVDLITSSYLTSIQQVTEGQSLENRCDREGGTLFRFKSIEFLDAERMVPLKTLLSGQAILIRVGYVCVSSYPIEDVVLSIGVFSQSGSFLFACRSDAVGKTFQVSPGEGYAICEIPRLPLTQGRYMYNLIAYHRNSVLDWVQQAGYIDVIAGNYYGTGKLPAPTHQGVLIDYKWRVQS